MSGPVPKHSSVRRRLNKKPGLEQIEVFGDVPIPPLRPGLNPLAAGWYASLATSGQSKYYEPSDWMMAQLLAEAIDQFITRQRATLLSTILTGAGSLLATEGDRRRLRLELTRSNAKDEDESAAVSALDDYRDRFAT